MSLSYSQIKFLEREMRGKSKKEILDMVGLLYKQNIRKFIQDKKKPKSINLLSLPLLVGA